MRHISPYPLTNLHKCDDLFSFRLICCCLLFQCKHLNDNLCILLYTQSINIRVFLVSLRMGTCNLASISLIIHQIFFSISYSQKPRISHKKKLICLSISLVTSIETHIKYTFFIRSRSI